MNKKLFTASKNNRPLDNAVHVICLASTVIYISIDHREKPHLFNVLLSPREARNL